MPSSAGERVKAARPLRRRVAIKFAAVMRWLHIYVSLIGLATVLFFSVTGVTLNHPNWFFSEEGRRSEVTGALDPKWMRGDVAKLEVVEHLRKEHGVRGAMDRFEVEDAECYVSFRGPAYEADARIRRDSGAYTLGQTSHGFVAILNDLHKGRDTGPVWSVVIDVSAVVLGVISLTGLVLLFYLKLRRVTGMIVVVVGTIALGLLYYLGVP